MDKHDQEKRDQEKHENSDSTWSAIPPRETPETSEMMAEQMRMRAELDKLARDNEALRRGHDHLLCLLSDSAAPRKGLDLKTAVRAVLTEIKHPQEGSPTAVVGPLPSIEELKEIESRFAGLGEATRAIDTKLGEVTAQSQSLGKRVEELAGGQKEFASLKVKMDQINAQRVPEEP